VRLTTPSTSGWSVERVVEESLDGLGEIEARRKKHRNHGAPRYSQFLDHRQRSAASSPVTMWPALQQPSRVTGTGLGLLAEVARLGVFPSSRYSLRSSNIPRRQGVPRGPDPGTASRFRPPQAPAGQVSPLGKHILSASNQTAGCAGCRRFPPANTESWHEGAGISAAFSTGRYLRTVGRVLSSFQTSRPGSRRQLASLRFFMNWAMALLLWPSPGPSERAEAVEAASPSPRAQIGGEKKKGGGKKDHGGLEPIAVGRHRSTTLLAESSMKNQRGDEHIGLRHNREQKALVLPIAASSSIR